VNSSIPIFISSDDNFAPFVAITIASICYNTNSFVDFYVLDDGITDFHKALIGELKCRFKNFTIEYIPVDSNSLFSKFTHASNITVATFNRLLIPILKPNINRALYLDVDIVVLGDIKKLYDEDLNKYIIGAVFDAGIGRLRTLHNNNRRIGVPMEHKYFNAGILLIDCKKWRDNDITSKVTQACEQSYHDQDILNRYFSVNNYKQLDIKYNITSNIASYYNKTTRTKQSKQIIEDYYGLSSNYDLGKTVIRHFAGCKPWMFRTFSKGIEIPNFSDFWLFASMTPFNSSLNIRFLSIPNMTRRVIWLFKILPIIGIKYRANQKIIYLFNIIPILTIK